MRLDVVIEFNEESSRVVDSSSDEDFYYKNPYASIKLSNRKFYPGTFCNTKNQIITFGYGKEAISQDISEEYLICSYDPRINKITVNRDFLCTWPLFYYMDQNYFILSSCLKSLTRTLETKKVEVSIDKTALFDLLVSPNIDERTLFKDIKLLKSDSQLIWSNGKINNSVRTYSINKQKDSSKPKDFKKAIEQTVENYLQRVDSQSAIIAFEWSGGLDSSFAPLWVNMTHNISPKLASIKFLEGFGKSQLEKYKPMQNRTESTLVSVTPSPDTHYPLARFASFGDYQPFYQYQEIYTECLDGLANKLAQDNVNIIFTGIGGDELFENNTEPVEDSLIRSEFQYISDKLWDNKPSRSQETTSPVADSAFFSNQSRNSIYISKGIWPVAPLADPKLYNFCQELPILARTNKNILRILYESYNWPKEIYDPVQNEHFGRFFDDSMKVGYKNRFHKIINDNSWLVKNSYILLSEVKDLYKKGQYTESSGTDMFTIFRIISAEIIISSVLTQTSCE